MGVETMALLAIGSGVIAAGSQIASGHAAAKSAKRQGEFDAQIFEQQAQMIENKKKVQERRDLRRMAFIRGSVVARTAGAGLKLSGSPLAILIDNESEMKFDAAIGQFNLDVQRNLAISQAERSRFVGKEQARLAKFQGYTNAFSTLLNTGASVGSLNLGSPTSTTKRV